MFFFFFEGGVPARCPGGAGREADGVTPDLLAAGDARVSLLPRVGSFNVAIAPLVITTRPSSITSVSLPTQSVARDCGIDNGRVFGFLLTGVRMHGSTSGFDASNRAPLRDTRGCFYRNGGAHERFT